MMEPNEQHIDELFRQAAEHYPLKTDTADWDKLSSALDNSPDQVAVSSRLGMKARRMVLLFLLLLSAGGITYFIWPAGRVALKTGESKLIKSSNKSNGVVRSSGADQSDLPEPKANALSGRGTNAPDVSSESNANALPQASTNDGLKQDLSATKGQSLAGTSRAQETQIRNNGNSKLLTESTANAAVDKAGQTDQGFGIIKSTDQTNKRALSLASVVAASGFATHDSRPSVSVTTIDQKALDLGYKSASGSKKNLSKLDAPRHHIYAGVLVAPDLSTIKFQPVNAVGVTFGILGGFSLSDRWALEAGVYLDRKKYSTDGQYFNTKNLYFLWNANLLYVSGYCDMVEIPLNVRFNLNRGTKIKWFVTSGLSSYMMFREKYTYKTESNGYINMDTHSYNTPYNYWFSVINLSAGLEQPLGKDVSLRIEPYARMPLSGIGTGSLPIMSAGLNIGITHRFK